MLSVYELKARVPVGLLALVPIAVTIVALGYDNIPVVAALPTVLSAIGGAVVLSVVVGNVGRRTQLKLWRSWGGEATLQCLRTRSNTVNVAQRDIWRAGITKYTGVKLKGADSERRRPEQADAIIRSAVGQVLHLGHGGPQGRTLVMAENAQYGLERNLYAFRWIGRGIALTACLVLGGALTDSRFVDSWVITGISVNAVVLIVWVFLPSESRARAANERYARQLLNAVAVEARSM